MVYVALGACVAHQVNYENPISESRSNTSAVWSEANMILHVSFVSYKTITQMIYLFYSLLLRVV